MNTENLKKLVHELTDLISIERKVVFIFIFTAALIKLIFWGLEIHYLSESQDLVFTRIDSNKKIEAERKIITNFKGNLFAFDPATVSYEELIELGFSDKVAHILINYRTKGGQFRDKSDVKKIYGVTPELYARIEPYIEISQRANTGFKHEFAKKATTTSSIDINLATKAEWKSLPGIGDYLSQKIVEKRNGLGAFVDIEQIGEIYKFPDSTFQKIRPFLTITKGTIKKININTANESELRQHPYILRWQADDILKNRPLYGLDDLYELKTYRDKTKNKFVGVYFEF
ncbi:MAG: helix-hairpin-helix domain-containing protein [Chitinophagales bacterium]|nr:helix-hairpin-helix domain-containing protein [Chitinophagales bacterium]